MSFPLVRVKKFEYKSKNSRDTEKGESNYSEDIFAFERHCNQKTKSFENDCPQAVEPYFEKVYPQEVGPSVQFLE